MTTLTLDRLRRANTARSKEWNVGPEGISLAFRGCELAGEAGEAANVLKKLERERIGLVGSRATIEHAADELADVVISADNCAMDLGINLAAAVVRKFNSTSEKYGFQTRLDPELPAKLNAWISEQVHATANTWTGHEHKHGMVSVESAVEIAQGAAVHVITDIETLIGNLRVAGYTVLPPLSSLAECPMCHGTGCDNQMNDCEKCRGIGRVSQ